MFNRFAAFAVTGLCLSAFPAFADNNITLLTQTGDANTAQIAQDGFGNTAGQHGNPARPDSRLLQEGNDNVMAIDQSGSANRVATGDLFRQGGNRNSLDLDQDGSGNEFTYMIQTANGTTAGSNILSIQQDGTDNRVKEIRQTRSGGTLTNMATITQSGERNLAGGRVTQQGAGNSLTLSQSGNDNTIAPVNNVPGAYGVTANVNSLLQKGQSNAMTVLQDGSANLLRVAQQQGDRNIQNVTLSGIGNGAAALDINRLTVSGAQDAAIWQVGNDNQANLTITGDNNAYGIAQQGDGNVVTATITGNQNAFALGQFGGMNMTTAIIDGTMNKMTLLQNGNGNEIDGKQDGANNTATITQNGSQNVAVFQQFGAHNSVSVSQ